VARKVLRLLGKSEDLIQFVKDRPGHDRRYAVDIGRLKTLDWKPRFSFEEALGETVEWYKTHAAWWQKLRKKKKGFQDYYQTQYGGKV